MLASLKAHFADLPDPRMKHKCRHRLLDIVIIASHDTFERVFRRLDPKAFEARFVEWVSAVFQSTDEQPVIAIDGKTLRGTESKLHLVSAWATNNGISLGS
jgi:hypothetical protein